MKSLLTIVLASLVVLNAKKLRYVPVESESLEDYNESTEHKIGYTPFDMIGTLKKSFALEVLSKYVAIDVICSPLSALLPLGKLILGTERGRSRNELLAAIGIKKSSVKKKFKELFKDLKYLPGVTLTIASRLYVDRSFRMDQKYADSTQSVFQSSLERINFKRRDKAAETINDWVNTQTRGMIPYMVDPSTINPETSMMLINAVYFLGRWLEPFRDVVVGDFHSPRGVRRIPMMTRKAHYSYIESETLNAKIISIPYEGMKSSFVVVLPSTKSGLAVLLSKLKVAPNLLNEEMDKMTLKMVKLTIPKFKINTELNLKDLYRNIGVTRIFTNHSGLTRISKKQPVFVSRAIQKACIEVTERGTEASAATEIDVMQSSSLHYKEITFRAEHPFLFFVTAERQQLFAGIFNNIESDIDNSEIMSTF